VTTGERIRTARKLRGLSQERLAALAGCSTNTIRNYEHDAGRRPLPIVLFAVARVLDLPGDDLLADANRASTQNLEAAGQPVAA
jgi:transcriptional regulator with XRE-family HTH domain